MTEATNGRREMRDGIMVTHLRSGDGATALVADHGAHLLSWCPADATEVIFLSQTSGFGDGEAVRGGVPIIFPQFGERGSGKRHGIARTREWQFVSAALDNGCAQARWKLSGRLSNAEGIAVTNNPAADPVSGLRADKNAASDAGGPNFLLTYDVRLARGLLQLVLTVANPLGDPAQDVLLKPDDCAETQLARASGRIEPATLRFHAALHTYLRVPDLATAGVQGLQGQRYVDQVLQGAQATQSADILAFAREVDRIYPDAPSSLRLQSPVGPLCVEQTGFADTVVWNPGVDKAITLSDLHPGGYREFICVEAAAIMRPISLLPGEHWRGTQRLSVA